MIMADNTAKQVELVKIHIDTPYYVGEVEAICLPDTLYDLLIGNIKGVHEPKGPEQLALSWYDVELVINSP